jgi:hypothetical protein
VDREGILADATPHGWDDDSTVELANGAFAVLTYPDGTRRFQHRCARPDRGTIICAPALTERHRVVDPDPATLTIFPSILCPDCHLHGHVTDGEWRPTPDST